MDTEPLDNHLERIADAFERMADECEKVGRLAQLVWVLLAITFGGGALIFILGMLTGV